jgi:hypothetical protein
VYLWIMTVRPIQYCSSLHYYTKFISKYSIKRALDTKMMSSYQFFKCRLESTHNKFHFYHLTFSKGRCKTISGEMPHPGHARNPCENLRVGEGGGQRSVTPAGTTKGQRETSLRAKEHFHWYIFVVHYIKHNLIREL